MKKKSELNSEDDLRAEYDFRALRVVARGPGRKTPNGNTVQLAPDVAKVFADSDSVNEALRLLIKVARSQLSGKT